mmetsp:Transcript_92526/g.267139  ORF Transcript_92526/g.267139 Transcript_92526/m.267139 type:complete len:287 (-) Transcript_92526:23-883(-)
MDAGVRDEVRLELGDVHIQRTVEAQRGGKRGDDLSQQPVEVRIRRPLDVEIPPADVVQCLVVVHDRHVRVLQEGVHAQDRVVRLDHSRGNLRAGPHREAQLALLAVVHGQTLQHQATETRAGAAAASVVDHEALEACAVVGKLPDAVEHEVHNLLADRVVPPREVVRRILFARDELLRVEELAVGACAHLVHDRWLQVHKDTARHVLARPGLREEGVECVIAAPDGLVRRHLPIRLDAMLQAEELPASVTDLDARLADMDADGLTHDACGELRSLTRELLLIKAAL